MCFKTTASSDDDGPHTAPGFDGASWGTAFANGNCTTPPPALTVPHGGRPLQMGTAPHRARLRRCLVGDGLCKWELHCTPASTPKRCLWLRRRDGARLRYRNGIHTMNGFDAETVSGFGAETVATGAGVGHRNGITAGFGTGTVPGYDRVRASLFGQTHQQATTTKPTFTTHTQVRRLSCCDTHTHTQVR